MKSEGHIAEVGVDAIDRRGVSAAQCACLKGRLAMNRGQYHAWLYLASEHEVSLSSRLSITQWPVLAEIYFPAGTTHTQPFCG